MIFESTKYLNKLQELYIKLELRSKLCPTRDCLKCRHLINLILSINHFVLQAIDYKLNPSTTHDDVRSSDRFHLLSRTRICPSVDLSRFLISLIFSLLSFLLVLSTSCEFVPSIIFLHFWHLTFISSVVSFSQTFLTIGLIFITAHLNRRGPLQLKNLLLRLQRG